MNRATNGQPATDTSREEGWKEGSQGHHLQQSSSTTDGSSQGEKGRLLLHIENARDNRSLFVTNARTTEEVRETLFREIPSLDSGKFVIYFYSASKEKRDRAPIEGRLSGISELYATVYLFKH